MNKTSYHSKLVGVTFEGRQEIIARLIGDEPLRFRREPDNEYDNKAVAVDALLTVDVSDDTNNADVAVIEDWFPIGYIARDKNKELASVLDAGKEASIKIYDITGGDEKSYGVNVYIEYEKERELVRSKTAFKVKDIFGNEIFYDDVTHKYTNALGEVYMSGSKFADQFGQPFDAQMISGKIASKFGLGPEEHQAIQDMWKLKAEASASFGTAIHAALELYGKYKDLAESIGKETHFHDNPVLNQAVELFYKEHPETANVGYECLVVDHKMKRAGRIDRLEYEEDGVWITDFKTNFDIQKSLKKYWLQLSFYAAIVQANGQAVLGLKIYHYTGNKWVTIESQVIDIDEVN